MNSKEIEKILKDHYKWATSREGSRANLQGANLQGANLWGANLWGANLQAANLREANLPHFLICPEEGDFIAWKKTTKGVIKIKVPEKARRTNSLTSRKCSASEVIVIDGPGVGGKSPNQGTLVYIKGDRVVADRFDDDIRKECTHGIHFFMTRKEAEEWC